MKKGGSYSQKDRWAKQEMTWLDTMAKSIIDKHIHLPNSVFQEILNVQLDIFEGLGNKVNKIPH